MRREWTGKCQRCGEPGSSYSMSYFNQDLCCMDCLADEKKCDGYARARTVELEQVRDGNYHFPGVGLGPDDERTLAKLRQARAEQRLREAVPVSMEPANGTIWCEDCMGDGCEKCQRTGRLDRLPA